MTREKLPSVVDRYFPGHAGIILTGSQAEHEDIYAGSDIDLLVFHPDYGSLYNTKLKLGDIKYDFTLAPLFDIENTIFNQGCDLNGTFLSMVANGLILADPHSILRDIQQYVRAVFNQVSGNTKSEYNRLLQELGRMNKLFERNLQEHERLFLVCEFVTTVVAIETIRIRKWRPTIKHRARLLYDKNRDLTRQLVEIVRQSVVEGAIRNLNPFLEYYNTARGTGMDMPVKTYGSLILDLAFADFSMKGFVEKVLPAILRHFALAAGYRYYYASPGNYWPAYRHQVCIRLDAGDPDRTMELIETLQGVLHAEGISPLESRVIFPREKAISELFDRAIESCSVLLCQWHTELMKEEQYQTMRLAGAISLCSLIMRKLGLSLQDFVCANLFLSQRWLIRQRELNQLGSYDALRELRIEKYRQLNSAFKKNQAMVLTAMASADNVVRNSSEPGLSTKIPEIPSGIRANLTSLLADRERYTTTLPFITCILMLLDIKQYTEVFIYVSLAEEIVQMLSLGVDQKSQCFYFMNEGVSMR